MSKTPNFGDAGAVEIADHGHARLGSSEREAGEPADRAIHRPDGRREVVGRQVHLAVAIEVSLHRDVGGGSEGLAVANQMGTFEGAVGWTYQSPLPLAIADEQGPLGLGRLRRVPAGDCGLL